ncbi:MAG TPA: DNA mismatch repair endonuclease MutL [Candidatus Megamonas gallistercoris]|nr:DNA mismatch repair endonuclease MutL [Candidatus Megamonas gallistercoris]
MTIHILDDVTVDKIAAGEVVERPASVIKELVENSIDARADKIEVEIMAGGTSFMRVTDNGTGMDMQNARLCVLRHATSKIQQVDDLMKINTLGFRGEALPSIAAVSRFCLMTRPQNADLGTMVKMTGGSTDEIEEVGCNIGTTIKVEDLFFNVPARKKFLKTTTTEANKINDFIVKLAFSKPHISFKLINNNKTTITTPGNNSLYDVIECIYGTKVSEELLPVEFIDEDIKITGFITKPAVIRSSRAWQTLIVNGRVITSRIIYKAIDNAYHSLLPKSGYPFAVLNIEIDKRTIDINVHPQKAEVKFEDENRLFKAVYTAVLEAIKPSGKQKLSDFAAPVADKTLHIQTENNQPKQTPLFEPSKKSSEISAMPVKQYSLNDFRAAQQQLHPQNISKTTEKMTKNLVKESSAAIDFSIKNDTEKNKYANCTDDTESIQEAGNLIPIGQIDACFIVAQGPNGGMYIIDQHAAHERILYDKFARQTDGIAVQPLLVHLFLDVSPSESDLIEEHQQTLYELGFNAELAGQNQIRLKDIPADIKSSEAETVFREILHSLAQLHAPTPQEIRHSCLAMTACKAAIKAGDILNIAQMKIILNELANTSLPYTCPHGRPTIIKFSTYDLEKMFRRVQ